MTSNNSQRLTEQWPDKSQFRRSIRIEFGAYIAILMLAVMIVTGFVISNQYSQTVMHSFVDRLLAEARSYSGSAGKLIITESGPDALLLNNICRKLQKSSDDIFWAAIADKDDRFLAHTEMSRVTGSATMIRVQGTDYQELLRSDESCLLTRDTVLIVVPIKEQDITLGHLGVAASARAMAAARTKAITTVAKITLVMILLGIPAATLLLSRKLRPIALIASSLRELKPNDIRIDIPLKSRNEFGYLAETLRVMGASLNRAQKEMIENERLARELEIARQIQARILPQTCLKGAGFEFASAYRSAKQVGGDYYDFARFDDHRVGFLVADVSGKSLPGMLLMLISRDAFQQLSRTVDQPAELLARMNQTLIADMTQGMFVTMFFGVFDSRTGALTYASAGHNPLIIYRSATGECESLKTRGFPLGTVPDPAFRARIVEATTVLAESDLLIQYTDGINEAHNSAQEEYTQERLIDMIRTLGRQTPEEMISGILDDVNRFVGEASQYDDLTLLVMKRYPIMVDKKRVDTGKEEFYAGKSN